MARKSIMDMLPVPNATGTNNFIRQPNVEDDGERYLIRADFKPGRNDNVFVRYIYADRTRFVPGFFGGVVDGTSTSAWGRNFLTSHSTVGGWTKVLGATLVNEARISWARGVSDGQQDPFGKAGPSVPGRARRPGGAGRRHRHRHHRAPAPRVAELHAEVPAHRPGPVPQHAVVAARQPPVQGRHRHHGADEQPSTSTSRRPAATCSSAASSPATPIADFLLGYARTAELSNVHIVNQRR